MKGRQIRIEPAAGGGVAAALMVNGRLEDLLIDPPDDDPAPRPEAIYLATVGRPMKGLGGVMLDLGDGGTGFLRGSRLPAPGRTLLVQVSNWAEPGKAPGVSDRLLLKGRGAILTPGAPGHNIARSLRDPEAREALSELAHEAMAGCPDDLGLIVRTAAADIPEDELLNEIHALRATWARVLERAEVQATGLVHAAPDAGDQAWREWSEPGTDMVEAPNALAEADLWEEIAALLEPPAALGTDAFMAIEPTRALIAVDVNTGRDMSPAAALKANLAAAAELPRQLRLRGLGGQVTVDFAPLAKADRRKIESALGVALRADGIDTTISGWTPLGNLELQRKRARRPLAGLAGQIAPL
ncbi:ribonuclease E/G [Rhodobacteraceae bacterium DSL-40]|uniref:ribonuclease E/G n=1 Tax=Amaricoccus sp. B4 TaxID=3368557 RepID=UPI000DACE1FD